MTETLPKSWFDRLFQREDVQAHLSVASEKYDSYTVDQLQAEVASLQEGLSSAMLALQVENRGWTRFYGFDYSNEEYGLTLAEVKQASEKLRQNMSHDLMASGARLLSAYVWSKGLIIDGTDRRARGRKAPIVRVFQDKVNKENLFGEEAHGELSRCAYTDGNILMLGSIEDGVRRVRQIPIREIEDVYVNPDYPAEVWAYLRQWTRPNSEGELETRQTWYYTSRVPEEKRTKSIQRNGELVPVDRSKTMFDLGVNKEVGYTWGIPDAFGALPWASEYSKAFLAGLDMTAAMAKIAYKISNNTKAGAGNSAAKIAAARGSGGTASMVQGQDLTALPTAGRSYEFEGLRLVAARFAAAIGVPVTMLLMDSSAAGSSYGAAETLSGPLAKNTITRQNIYLEFIQEIVEWLLDGKDVPDIRFPKIEDETTHRLMQSAVMAWNTGLLHLDEARPKVLELMEIRPTQEKAPDGVLLPNNKDSWERADIDPNSSPASPNPTQGVNTGAGKDTTNANDIRTEQLRVAENLRHEMAMQELAERIEAAIAQIPKQ